MFLRDKLELLELRAPEGGNAGAGSNDEEQGGKPKGSEGEGDGDGDGKQGDGEGAGGSNPLLPDLQKWKGKARTALDENARLKRENAQLKAGSDEELEAVRAKHAQELDARERRIAVTELALDAKVGKAFLAQALQEADSDSSAAEIVERAKAAQAEFLSAHGAADEGGAGGDGKQQAFGGGGGASPGNKGKRIWTPEEVAAVDPLDTEANEELRQAIAEGRVKR